MEKGFNIPSLIPPLPTSSATGKENEKENAPRPRVKSTKVLKREPTSVTKTPKRQANTGLHTPHVEDSDTRRRPPSIDFHLTSTPGASSNRRSVLRYGETTETLFCLTRESSQEHRRLCREIMEGTRAENPACWREVLELASTQNKNGSDLIRLHRRAALRFPIDQLVEGGSRDDILAIWLSFARIQAKWGSVDEAKRTFRHIENQQVPLGASFYLEMAALAKNDGDIEVLKRGIKRNAQPVQELENALKSLQNENSLLVSSGEPARKRLRDEGKLSGHSTQENGFKDDDLKRGTKTPRIMKEAEAASSITFIQRGDTSEGTPNGNAQSIHSKAKVVPSSRASQQTVPVKRAGRGSFEKKAVTVRQHLRSSRLSRKGLSGKAKRVDPEFSFIDGSEDETELDSKNDTIETLAGGNCEKKSQDGTQKIKKLDLSYMWDWDPNARGKTQEAKPQQPNRDKPEEECTSGHLSNTMLSSEATNSLYSGSSNPQSSRPSELSQGTQESPSEMVKEVQTSKVITAEKEGDQSSAKMGSILEKVNPDFLPLVHEDNILRVNETTYAKLGVIGKGGSCKVYRALSKKCSVVAIKKVKLEGMDEKAIEGYANEISLLKRLRGNPAIIQMYDSEVDLQRKSIFVVMELGEVDLNQVLRQRALAGMSRSLNMNFIRLTWQQMLSAVHSIHEERIIHSDLKPANFLFVRGALKLIDFGIAKAIQSDDTTNIYRESHIGTLNYMSPESILDTGSGDNGVRMKIGRASDVWSLGCILYEMVFGETPFAKLHFIQKLQAITNPNHQIYFPDEGDEAAVDAIKQCLQRNPEVRPPIVGRNGLLSKHHFLHSSRPQKR